MRKPWVCYPSPVGGGSSPPGESPILETDIKKIIVTDPTIHQQGYQGTPTNTLVQLSTKQFCQQVGDQTCISAERNFKLLFVQTTQNASGDWVSNGAVQNISPDSLEQVITTLHLYDCSGRIVGYTEGFTIPYNLDSIQTTIFNQTVSPTNLTGTPKFFRVSFDSASVSNSTGYNAITPPLGANSTGYNPPLGSNSTGYNPPLGSNSTGYNPPLGANSTGYTRGPWLGISGGGITPDIAQSEGLPSNYNGVVVGSVQVGSPPEKAGIQGVTQNNFSNAQTLGNIITGIDGHPLKSIHDLIN